MATTRDKFDRIIVKSLKVMQTIVGAIQGNVIADDGTVLVNAATKAVAATVTGNITGNVTGNLTGNVTGGIKQPVVEVTADGAIAVPTVDTKYVITKAGVAAMTIVDPTDVAHDGITLTFISATANAHTLTRATTGFNDGGAGADVATWGGAKGDGIQITAWDGKWYVNFLRNVTLA